MSVHSSFGDRGRWDDELEGARPTWRKRFELGVMRVLAIAGAVLVLAGLLGIGSMLERAILGAP